MASLYRLHSASVLGVHGTCRRAYWTRSQCRTAETPHSSQSRTSPARTRQGLHHHSTGASHVWQGCHSSWAFSSGHKGAVKHVVAPLPWGRHRPAGGSRVFPHLAAVGLGLPSLRSLHRGLGSSHIGRGTPRRGNSSWTSHVGADAVYSGRPGQGLAEPLFPAVLHVVSIDF